MELEKNIKFLNMLKEIEDHNILTDENYKNTFDKYTNGECELLAYFFFMYNQKGSKVEIKGFSDDGVIYHYVYKSEDGLYFDINGETEDINELIKNSTLYDYVDEKDIKIKEYQINDTYDLEYHRLYQEVVERLN